MRNLWIFSQFQLRMLFRDYKLTLIGFLVPVLSFIVFSNLFSGQNYDMNNVNIVDYLIPAFILVIIVNAVLLMFGQYYAAYSDSGTLLKYKLLGIKDWIVTLSIFIASFVFQVSAILILVIVGNISKGISIPYANVVSIIPAIFLINLLQYSYVLLLQSLTKNATAYNSIAIVIFNYQMFLGGLTFPPEIMPPFLLNIIKYGNPIYYGLLLFRGVWTEEKQLLHFGREILILFAVSLIVLLISYIIRQKKEL